MTGFIAYDGGCYSNAAVSGTNLPQILEGIDDPKYPTIDPIRSRIIFVGGDAVNSINTSLTVAQMEDLYTQILAKLSRMGLQPVLGTLLPTSLPASNVQIVALNAWLRATAAAQNIPLFDLYEQPGMTAADGTLSTAVSSDGTHIIDSAYAPFTTPVEADLRLAAAKAGL
jgi:lysophospholipase L1-like esterase